MQDLRCLSWTVSNNATALRRLCSETCLWVQFGRQNSLQEEFFYKLNTRLPPGAVCFCILLGDQRASQSAYSSAARTRPTAERDAPWGRKRRWASWRSSSRVTCS